MSWVKPEEWQVLTVCPQTPTTAYKATMCVNSFPITMEIHTEAAVTLISYKTHFLHFNFYSIQLRIYIHCTPNYCPGPSLSHDPVQGTHTLTVVKGNGPSLLGRDWLSHIRLDWAEIRAVSVAGGLSWIMDNYADDFQGSGTMKHIKAHLTLRGEDAQPIVRRLCQVPYAI